MGVLLLLVGALALGSGALKLWRRGRTTVGASPLAIIEVGVGVATVMASASGVARVRPAAWGLVVLTLAVVGVSLVVWLRQVHEIRERREASEADRLKWYLEARKRE